MGTKMAGFFTSKMVRFKQKGKVSFIIIDCTSLANSRVKFTTQEENVRLAMYPDPSQTGDD